MNPRKKIMTLSVLAILLLVASNVTAATLTVGTASVTADQTAQITLEVDVATGIAGAAFTIQYDTANLTLATVTSTFFDTFASQWAGLTPVPDPLPPTSVTVDSQPYTQPLIRNDVTGTGTRIAAARAMPADETNKILFTLTFQHNNPIGLTQDTTYNVQVVSTSLNNTDAGYDPAGETIPMLVASDLGVTDLTSPAAFPVVLDPAAATPVGSVVNGSVTFTTPPCTSGTDSDSDGIDDCYETTHFGNLTTADATTDYDQDGYSDLDEYTNGAGYDPVNIQEAAGGTGYDPCTDNRVTGCGATGWQTTINAVGQDLGGVYEYQTIFGVKTSAETLSAAPAPPQYSVKMELKSSDGLSSYSKDVRLDNQTEYFFILAINPHGNIGFPSTRSATISWDSATFDPDPTINYTLYEGVGDTGPVAVADMRSTTQYVVTGTSDTDLYYTIKVSPNCQVTLNLAEGWNLVSLPVTPADTSLTALFPDAEVAYGFNGAYQQATSLTPGLGYWVKVPSAASYAIEGACFSGYTATLSAGWHLMGAGSGTATPTTTPTGSIEVMYGFSGAYSQAFEFIGGQGYWVKITTGSDFVVEGQ